MKGAMNEEYRPSMSARSLRVMITSITLQAGRESTTKMEYVALLCQTKMEKKSVSLLLKPIVEIVGEQPCYVRKDIATDVAGVVVNVKSTNVQVAIKSYLLPKEAWCHCCARMVCVLNAVVGAPSVVASYVTNARREANIPARVHGVHDVESGH